MRETRDAVARALCGGCLHVPPWDAMTKQMRAHYYRLADLALTVLGPFVVADEVVEIGPDLGPQCICWPDEKGTYHLCYLDPGDSIYIKRREEATSDE